ncbi:MAG: UDP-N-acetylglucosamine--N-acetylmuramyl-(pentapeptide) pyrophosphoryl-undecaprenol N-acetylglucosamine transferase [Phycisphaeraceae bacterium]|nr:UDP-N-acetylglucosamine--N-acetylmuramyl-(pentapeptide) pyrophosphoryl-undecaprenol N-acetylglucosamine transferase [Phycisphaeraceae bacterium]
MSGPPVILFAGGGTGGHIYPNLAIEQALATLPNAAPFQPLYAVSNRAVDRRVIESIDRPALALPMLGLRMNPLAWPALARSYRRSIGMLRQRFDRQAPAAVVATGGFVSVPVVHWAMSRGIPTVVVNLDAVPGRANRHLARRTAHCFTAYATAQLSSARVIGFPLRQGSIGDSDPGKARRALGFDPVSPMLLIVGGSSGAESLNRTVAALVGKAEVAQALQSWNILHLHGQDDPAPLVDAYRRAELRARVEPFLDPIGNAWSGAAMAISRAGAGSVAEAWANACPTLFLPYPFHRDQHQKHNARPLVDIGGAAIVDDPADPRQGTRALGGVLMQWLTDADQRQARRNRLIESRPVNGATVLAQHLQSLGYNTAT